MSLLDRVCKQCKAQFSGGPRAYYCPSCRKERQRQQGAAYQRRKRAGTVHRPLGSIDQCERCGQEYTVKGGLQRFCQDCQPIHAKEYDRETSIEFYHVNKERINPVRNNRRRIGLRKCEWCGAEFDHRGTKRLTCSDECRRQLKNKKYRDRYNRKK